jgi:hypothetical protein
MNEFYIIYYPLYMLIIQVHHDSGCIHDFGCMPNSDRKIWLCSYVPTPVALSDSGRRHNSGHASRLRPMSMLHVLPPQLWKTLHGRARWLQHLTVWTLNLKQTGRDAWLVQRSEPQHLTASHVQVSGHVPRDRWTLSPAWHERNSSIQKDSVPLQLGWIKVFECLVRWAKALCRVTMALRTNHTWENP